MKKQSGFTLIELMVVMAIIAILATAGLSAYTGYITKARDTKRIADMSAINTIITSWMSSTGKPPQTGFAAQEAIKDMNNNQKILDPMKAKHVCLNAPTGDVKEQCRYLYTLCDEGSGFAVATMFESKTNQSLYAKDPMGIVAAVAASNAVASQSDGYYSVGSCSKYCAAVDCGISGAIGKYDTLE